MIVLSEYGLRLFAACGASLAGWGAAENRLRSPKLAALIYTLARSIVPLALVSTGTAA